MSVFRRSEKPSAARRLADLALSIGVLALIVGLVGAFLVAGVYGVHASLDRNEDPHAARAPEPPPAPKPAPKPPPPPAVAEIAVAPAPKPLAKPVDPSRVDEEGFIKYWLLLAPIPAEKEMAGGAEVVAQRLPDEARLRPRPEERVTIKGKEHVWRRYRTSDFAIDFKQAVEGQRGDDVLAYAVCYVHAPEERRDVKLFIGSNDQGKVYLNGQAVLTHEKPRSLKKDHDVVAGLTLLKGENVVILKVANERGNWQGCLRFGDKAGTPMVDLHVTTTPR
ncbi:MAG TPA: hypothetical protein VF950_15000 [Planctomycetota bacterium]